MTDDQRETTSEEVALALREGLSSPIEIYSLERESEFAEGEALLKEALARRREYSARNPPL